VLGKIYSLNTVKHNCLITSLFTGSLILYSFRQQVSVVKVYNELKMQGANASHIAFLVHCRPDDGRLTTETCCLNEYNIRLPVTRILIKQLCLTLLSEYIKIVLNTLDSVDQATGFVHPCARHLVDLQVFRGSCIFVIRFKFLISMERSLMERIFTVTRTA
jgi:hypothetical protein